MISGAEVSTLGDADVVSNLDICQVVDPDILAYPGAVPDREKPGVFDTDAGLDYSRISNAGSEDSQKNDADPGRRQYFGAEHR